MGIITKLSLKSITDWLEKSYAITPSTVETTANGISDTTYRITTTEGRELILKRFERCSPALIDAEHALLKRLHGAGLQVPLPIKPHHICLLEDKPGYLYTAMEGEHPLVPDLTQIEAVGYFLGSMHSLTKGTTEGHPFSHLCKELEADIDATPFAPYRSMLQKMIDTPPDGIIHGDLFPDNALFAGERLGVIDFIEACPGAFGFDLGVVAFSWCNGEKAKQKALLQAYRRALPETDLSIDSLNKAAAHAALFYGIKRFLRTPDPKHPRIRECLAVLEDYVSE